MSHTPSIRTERCTLRPFDATDALEIFDAVYSDAGVMRHVAGGAHATLAETERALKAYAEHQARHGFSFWAVTDNATGGLLGDCGLYLLEGVGPEVELGFTLRRAAWGRGIGTEIAIRTVRFGFEQCSLETIVAVNAPENERSAALLRRIGFEPIGSRTVYGAPHEAWRLSYTRFTEVS